MKQSVFYIARMDCPTEEQLIRNRLKRMESIDDLRFNLMQRELTVTHRADDDQGILAALSSLGMEPKLRTAPASAEAIATSETASCCGEHDTHDHHEHPAVVPTATKVLMGLSGITAAAAEAVAWTSGTETSPPVIALAIISILSGGRDTLRKGVAALRTLTLNINFLMMLAVAGAVAIGQWPEAAMVTFLFGVAEMIEAFSLERARNAIRGLMEMSPETAAVQDKDGQWRDVDVSAVSVGQIVRVKPGERIPLDGTVTGGHSTVNQAPITGESLPVEKKGGDVVFAGTINERGVLEFRVTGDKGHTTLARIIRTVQEAQAERAPTQRFIDRFARYYTPGVVAFAVLVAVVPPLFFGAAFAPWLYKALVMLVIACPCALVISTPVTVVSGLTAAARRGILVKGGAYLELGRNVKAVALDKTGTLTHGAPAVTDVIALTPPRKLGTPLPTSWDREREGGVRVEATLLQLAASLDAHSEHPVASAIVAHWTGADHTNSGSIDEGRLDAVRRSGELLPVTGFESITGRGVKGVINGQLYYIGNHRLAEENGVCGPHVETVLDRLEEQGKTAVVLSSDKEALSVLGVADTLRATSVEALRELHDLGITTVMLTGDNQTTARAIACGVGIDDVRGNLLPQDKLAAMNTLLQQHGTVGMVGDGINDAPALAKASIGFAMGAAGTDTAMETADVALMHDDLRKLPLFLKLSRQTSRVLVQNIALAIGIKAIFFALALLGHATLWMAVFADMGASLLVVFNGLRLLRFGEKPL